MCLLGTQLLTLSIDMNINEINQWIAVILCHKVETANFSHDIF